MPAVYRMSGQEKKARTAAKEVLKITPTYSIEKEEQK